MKSWMLAGMATLSFSAALGGVAIAQDASTAQPPGADASTAGSGATTGGTPVNDGTPMPGADASAAPTSDPNAGQPTGAVPANPAMVPAPAGAPQDPAAPVGSSANPVQVGGNMTPPPAEAKDYPLCSRTVQDSCVNPGEARKGKAKRR